MSEIKRKKGESFEGFLRRVKQQWQLSGKLIQARKIQYFEPKKSKNIKRTSTVTSIQKKSKMEYLRKTGRLPAEEENRFQKRKRR